MEPVPAAQASDLWIYLSDVASAVLCCAVQLGTPMQVAHVIVQSYPWSPDALMVSSVVRP
jgi:hypothetical protein